MSKENNQYIQQKWNRKKNFCHWKLGIGQMKQHLLLNIVLIPIIFLTVFIWMKMDYVFTVFDVPKIILPMYTIIIRAFGVLIPILLIWGLIDIIGTLTAQEDEATIQMAFKKEELRNGSPILMYKQKDKKSGVTVREFYSPIPMRLWVERQKEIEDHMNIHFVQNFRYGGKSNGSRIVMHSAKGKEATARGVLYDDK